MITNTQREFYEKCLSEGVTLSNCKEPFYNQKALQIASSLNLKIDGEVERVLQSVVDCQKEESFQKQLETARKEEPELLIQYSKFSDLYGVDKPINMVSEIFDKRINQLESDYKICKENEQKCIDANLAQVTMSVKSMEKEKDWAIAGGVAQGLAGPAAGVASAVNTQLQNASIRARNDLIRSAAVDTGVKYLNLSAEWGTKAQKLKIQLDDAVKEKKSEIEKYKFKVIGEQSDDEAFKYVIIDFCNSFVSVTGAVLLEVAMHLDSSCNVFGEANAHVDGSFAAIIYQNGDLLGVADLVLPLSGLQITRQVLKGICLCTAENNKKCSVTIIPKNLWVVEN